MISYADLCCIYGLSPVYPDCHQSVYAAAHICSTSYTEDFLDPRDITWQRNRSAAIVFWISDCVASLVISTVIPRTFRRTAVCAGDGSASDNSGPEGVEESSCMTTGTTSCITGTLREALAGIPQNFFLSCFM